ncbi:MAG: hypothetical protein ACKPKO_53980, partial [Candidatus Fonsibacter sp.]
YIVSDRKICIIGCIKGFFFILNMSFTFASSLAGAQIDGCCQKSLSNIRQYPPDLDSYSSAYL